MTHWPDYVCTNPSCHSYGKSHPNCRCEPPEGHYAEGGRVSHFCESKLFHHPECEHFATGGEVADNNEFINDPHLAVDHAVANHGLLHTLSRTGFTKSEEPGRAHAEFLDSSRHGAKALKRHSDCLLQKSDESLQEPDEEQAMALYDKLSELKANPEKALNIGGNLGDSLPMHHAMLAAKAATAANYLNNIKPKPQQAGPLDPITPVSRHDERLFKRQAGLVENPRAIYHHARQGDVIPNDLQTLNAVYPKLSDKMKDHAFNTLAESAAAGKELSHKQKRSLGVLMQQRLQFEQTPQAAMAIMQANAGSQPPAPPQKKPKKASGVELKQINAVNELSKTPLQKLQSAKND